MNGRYAARSGMTSSDNRFRSQLYERTKKKAHFVFFVKKKEVSIVQLNFEKHQLSPNSLAILVINSAAHGGGLSKKELTLAELLKKANYSTAALGKVSDCFKKKNQN